MQATCSVICMLAWLNDIYFSLLHRVNTSKGYTRADLVKRLESLQVLPLTFTFCHLPMPFQFTREISIHDVDLLRPL